jgi:hypothetical protein
MPAVADRPIYVSSTADTKTLFRFIGDRRVRFGLAADPAAPAPDVLAVPCPTPAIPFDDLIGQAPAACWARVRDGEALVLFDASGEGHPHDPVQMKRLLAFLDANGLPHDRAVMVTQDRTFGDVHRAWMSGEGRGDPIHVLNYDFFIKTLLAAHEAAGADEFARREAAFAARQARREKRFISLNFTPRVAKVAFLLRLLHDGFWDQGFISFGGFAPPGSGRATQASVIGERLRDSRAFGGMMAKLEPDLERLEAMGPRYLSGHQRRLDLGGRNKTPIYDEHLPEHERSWFTVVTETEIEGPRRVTEKAFKPLLGFHPVLLLGNAGSLALLREFGFRTFYGYFDEAYDEEPDPRRRFMRVYSEVLRLCRLDEAQLHGLEQEWAEVLTHNARWGLEKLPRHYREVIDPAFMDQVAALLGRRPDG